MISVEAINDPKSYMVGKKLLEMKKTPSSKDIVSNKINLKDMLREIKWELLEVNGRVEK